MSQEGKNMGARYYNFKESVTGKAQLLTLDQLENLQTHPNKDYYLSIFAYNEAHKKRFEENGSLAGIRDVTTDTLVWDFDSKDNVEQARKDTVELGRRLVEELKVDPDSISCFMSGSKGFHVVLPLNREVTPEEFKKATTELAKGLDTFDTVVHDPQRLLRLEHTKHPKTGLYKVPLHIAEVDELNMDQIKEIAKTPRTDFEVQAKPVVLPNRLFDAPKKEAKLTVVDAGLDFSKKPKNMQDYVYAILEGHFESGERHQALMVLAAKCRAQGWDKEQTYYLCKSALKKQAARTGSEEFDKSELFTNIIEKSVYSDRWEGGSYSPKTNPWLQKLCDRLGIRWSETSESNVISVGDTFSAFESFAKNIDKNTIKTGIKELDEKLRLTIGMSSGLVASPGVGKTSLTLQMLNSMSKEGHGCLFFSYDMYGPIVFQKLVQKHFNINSTAMFQKFNSDPKFRGQVKEKLDQEYKNVNFCFKTGQNVPDIIDTIKEAEDKRGQKIKFIAVDYNELVMTDYSDATASSAFVAQKMREIAQSMDLHVFSLFQPSKVSGTPADEIKSYNSAKGSGAIAQSVSVMLGMSRPGYNPQAPEDDRFLNLACLKNRMGPLFSLDFGWHGLTGTISELDDENRTELKKIREKRAAAAGEKDNGWS